MKKKVKQVNLDDFALAMCDIDDKSLPHPRGTASKKPAIDEEELKKLERTIEFGGLVPERSPILDALVRRVGKL